MASTERQGRWKLMGAQFASILDGDGGGVRHDVDPDCVGDLHLDVVCAAIVSGREEYELEPLFYAPLRDVGTVAYRQSVLRDLERPEVGAAVRAFGESMRRIRGFVSLSQKQHYHYEKERWLLDAAVNYCDAVEALTAALALLELGSAGLHALREFLDVYARSKPFVTLAAAGRVLRDELAAVRYTVRIRGGRVTVGPYDDEPEYTPAMEETFARFRQGTVESRLATIRDSGSMDHVEAQIVSYVARLFPGVFGALDAFCVTHHGFLDPTLVRFDREVQLLLGYLELVERLRAAGLPFCYPEVSARSKDVRAEETFDLALALGLVAEGRTVVCNDLRLDPPERIVVVTGPNNGGKTTFARMVGELHYLASLGLPVPGRRARLGLPDRILTHFEREEGIETLRGKLEDELVRLRAVLERATPESVILMNETFGSTSLNDALVLGRDVLERIAEIGALTVYVTFVDELASLCEETVSMVARVVPEDPAQRTFEVVRRPADGLAYAWAIAEKYGLTRAQLAERIPS